MRTVALNKNSNGGAPKGSSPIFLESGGYCCRMVKSAVPVAVRRDIYRETAIA